MPLVRIQAGVDEALSCSSDHVSVATDFSSLRTRRARLIRSWVSCSACISSAHEEAIEGMGKYAERTTSLHCNVHYRSNVMLSATNLAPM